MRNPFESLQRDEVFIEAPDGTRAGPFKTSVTVNNGHISALIFDDGLNVELGWKLFRLLPNGKEDSYTVSDAQYAAGLDAIPGHWNLELEKETSLKGKEKRSPTTIHITNSQGIQIGDHNVQHIANSLTGLIEKIDASGAPIGDKQDAKNRLRELLTSPVVASVLGSATTGLLALLA